MTRDAQRNRNTRRNVFEWFSIWVSRTTGTTGAFMIAAGLIAIWLITGPFFGFSPTWQLIINTGTTIITFLMVFVIQRAQNKESLAIHLKLNELIASSELSSNRLVGVEDLTEEELYVLQKYYKLLAQMAKHAAHLQESHSIEEAEAWHQEKTAKKATKKRDRKNNDPPAGGHIISSSE